MSHQRPIRRKSPAQLAVLKARRVHVLELDRTHWRIPVRDGTRGGARGGRVGGRAVGRRGAGAWAESACVYGAEVLAEAVCCFGGESARVEEVIKEDGVAVRRRYAASR